MGTLPGQQAVFGFSGKALVNSFLGGDEPHGKLISPPFKIERPWIGFLLGGGGDPAKTSINLIVDGQASPHRDGADTARSWIPSTGM